MATLVRVRVHRRGRNPELSAKLETVVKDGNGALWTRVKGSKSWWKLSREAPGGWHSVNVGFPLGFSPL